MSTILQYIFGFGAFALVIYFIKKLFDHLFHNYAQELDNIMEALAKDYGLESRREDKVLGHTDWTPLLLSGKVNNFETSISIVRRGHGEDHYLAFYVEIAIQNPRRFHLELYKNGVFNRGLFGHTKLDLGDPLFQKYFIFRTAKPDLLPQVLDEEIRASALSIKKSFYLDQIRLRGNKIQFERHALHQKKLVKKFRNVLNLLFQIADKVDQL